MKISCRYLKTTIPSDYYLFESCVNTVNAYYSDGPCKGDPFIINGPVNFFVKYCS